MSSAGRVGGFRRWLPWIVGAIGLVVVLVAITGMITRRWARDEMDALRARGEKLTFDELAYPWLTNGAPRTRALVNAVNGITAKPPAMGMVPLMDFVAPGRARVVVAGESVCTGMASETSWDELESQMRALEGELGIIRESLSDPEPDFGVDPKNFIGGIKRPYLERRMAAQLLGLDVVRHLHARRLSEAAASLHALAQATHLHGREPTLVAQMISVAVMGFGVSTTWEALQVRGWSEEQLAVMQRDWESVDVPAMLENAFVGERAMGLEFFSMMRRQNPARLQNVLSGRPGVSVPLLELLVSSLIAPIHRALLLPGDERMFLRSTQERVDCLRLLKEGRPALEVRERLAAQEARLEALFSSWRRIRYTVTGMALPNGAHAVRTAVRNMTLLRLGIVAIALERYKLQNGRYPEGLGALVPRWMKAVARDPMDGKPLRYRVEADGSYRLWSIGEDGVDQGGDPQRAQPGSGTMFFWDARDFVWPMPASLEEVGVYDRDQAARRAKGAVRRKRRPGRRGAGGSRRAGINDCESASFWILLSAR